MPKVKLEYKFSISSNPRLFSLTNLMGSFLIYIDNQRILIHVLMMKEAKLIAVWLKRVIVNHECQALLSLNI